MLSAVPMCKLSVIVLDRDRRTLLRGLGKLGVMHLLEAPVENDTEMLAPIDYSGSIDRCEQLMQRLKALRSALAPAVEVQPADKQEVDQKAILSVDEIDALLTRYESSLESLSEREVKLRKTLASLDIVLEQLRSFSAVDLPIAALPEYSFLHFAIGSLPRRELGVLRDSLEDDIVTIELPRNAERSAIVAVASRKGRFALETALKDSGFKHEEWPSQDGTPVKQLLEETEQERDRIDKELAELDLAKVGLGSTSARRMAALEDRLKAELRLLAAESKLPRTNVTSMVTGWVPEEESDKVVEEIKTLTQGRSFIESVPASRMPASEVPVLLRHSRFMRPFAALVTGYGLPSYREIEPTIFVAFSYMLMFGMMFGDVGHGGVLALGGLLAIWRSKKTQVKDVGVLLVMAGLASVAFGFVYGSCFGLEGFHRFGLWRDPLEGSPISLMLLAMGVGFGIISLGVILNIINRFRHGDWLGGFLDSYGVVGFIFYWGVLGLLLRYASLKESGRFGLVLTLVVILPILAWVVRGPIKYALESRRRKEGEEDGEDEGDEGDGLFAAFMESVVESFEAVLSYMANTISFVRLAAYAMSHAAVLMATFVMAKEVAKAQAVGGALSIVVIIIGNFIAIALEGIVAGVQALRLEYYEFFSKFFSGSGVAFDPFRLRDSE